MKRAISLAQHAVLFVAMVFAAEATSRMFPHMRGGYAVEGSGSETVFASTLLSEVFLFAIWKVGDAFGLNAPGPSMGFIRKYIPSARTAVIALVIASVAGGVFATIRDGNTRAKEQAEKQAKAVADEAERKWSADTDKAIERIEKAYEACARKYSTKSDAIANCTDWREYSNP